MAEKNPLRAGETAYEQWREQLHADPKYQKVYAEEAVKGELWLQLVEARKGAGLTQSEMAERLGVSQSQVARIERNGYDAYTLNTLRRYVAALGDDFELQISIKQRSRKRTKKPVAL